MTLRHKPRRTPTPEAPPETSPEFFSLEMGETYEDFWDAMAGTPEGAYLGVAGKPFGEPATNESLREHGAPTAEVIARKLDLTNTDVVLDIGVGVGRIAEHIAPRVAEVHGMDISSNMIAYARERVGHLGNLFLYHHAAGDLSLFPDEKFDAVYAQIVFIHLDREDMYRYVCESHRVLRPGGRVFFQFYNLLHDGGWREFEFAVQHMLDLGGKNRGRVHCHTAPEIRRYVEGAGLVLDEAQSHLNLVDQDFDFPLPDEDWRYYLIAVARRPDEPLSQTR